ncbi:phosphodiesterase [Azospirillum sp. TSO35-2]|nr:phosphodiesterase [Azospirillum sp. TSO35-2]
MGSGGSPGPGGEACNDNDTSGGTSGNRWTMLIVDDEPEVHSITKLVLSDFAYKGRKARFLSAHSAAEARAILARETDIALILLDVVMETEDAGLRLVHHIREELENRNVRIILRTGQPGQAPERAVILDYDINDYKAKTQLTAQQLFTTTVAALRSYEDIMAIDANRRGLEKIIEASSSLFRTRSMKLFAAGVLTQLSGLLGVGPDAILCVQRGPHGGGCGGSRGDSPPAAPPAADGLYVLAGSGRFETLINEPAADHVDPPVLAAVTACLEQRANHYAGDHCTLYIRVPNDRETVVYLRSDRPLSDLDRKLIEVFCGKISVGFDNLHHYEQLYRAQEGTLAALADLAERGPGAVLPEAPGGDPAGEGAFSRSLRIAAVTERIARRLHADGRFPESLDESFLEIIGLAAILHDIGNATVNPAILAKPGPLDPAERAAMQGHTVAGATLLNQASHLADGPTHLHLGAAVARWHHENWDGTGYPDGRTGAAIPLCARIVAVADAYDAMTRDRPYRAALGHDGAVAEIRRLAGLRFDPVVVEAFLAVAPEIGTLDRSGR